MQSLLDNPMAQMQFDTNNTVIRTKVKVIVKDNHIATFATANDFSDGFASADKCINLLTQSKYPATLSGSICKEGPSTGKFVVNVWVKNVMLGWFNHPKGKEMDLLRNTGADELDEVKSKAVNQAELNDLLTEISE